MKIKKDTVVSFRYSLSTANGEFVGATPESEPLVFLHGHGTLIEALENKLVGRSKGDKFEIMALPEEAYGVSNPDLIQTVPKANFEGEENLEVGMQMQVESNMGTQIAILTEIKENDIVLDLNHILAGETLHFDIEIIDVREATASEIEQGHVHKEG